MGVCVCYNEYGNATIAVRVCANSQVGVLVACTVNWMDAKVGVEVFGGKMTDVRVVELAVAPSGKVEREREREREGERKKRRKKGFLAAGGGDIHRNVEMNCADLIQGVPLVFQP